MYEGSVIYAIRKSCEYFNTFLVCILYKALIPLIFSCHSHLKNELELEFRWKVHSAQEQVHYVILFTSFTSNNLKSTQNSNHILIFSIRMQYAQIKLNYIPFKIMALPAKYSVFLSIKSGISPSVCLRYNCRMNGDFIKIVWPVNCFE